MYAQSTDQDMQQFATGQRLGECLVRGCAVFLGVVKALGNPQQDPGESDPARAMTTLTVEMEVTEWLWGKPEGSSVELLYATRPQETKTGLGPWSPWRGVTVEPGGELLVARWAAGAPRGTWMGKPEDVALVVSDESQFGAIREAIAEHRRFERMPNEVQSIPRLIGSRHDKILTGYAVTFLMEAEPVRNVDRAATVLSQLIGNEAVPPAGRIAIGNWFATTFYGLSPNVRQTATQALVDAASADRTGVAYPAVSVLVRLAEQKALDLPPIASDARQRRIVENYRAFLAQNKGQQASPELESRLGLR